MSEYKSKRNWINNAPLTIVDLGSLHPPASGSLLVTTATASPRSAALQSENPFCVICLKVNVSSPFDLSVHSFVSYERIGKWDEERYRKGGRKPYFIELGGTPRWINLYAVADADVYYNYEA